MWYLKYLRLVPTVIKHSLSCGSFRYYLSFQERQIQLIRELLMCDASGSIQLSEEQKSALAFLNRPQVSMGGSGNKR